MIIDTSFDMRTDSFGKDPDFVSPTLKSYHKILWSKKLPCGKNLVLDEKLKNTSDAGIFEFSSDSIIHTFSKWKRNRTIIEQIPNEIIENFLYLSYTIGGMIIFPANRIDGKNTINGERGFNNKIRDRFDLTLECIRRYYNNENSPLFDCFNRYSDFFTLFSDFRGYVDFFFLQDLVDNNYSCIKFFLPFDDFVCNPIPATVDEYLKYKDKVTSFVKSRNDRIEDWVKGEIL